MSKYNNSSLFYTVMNKLSLKCWYALTHYMNSQAELEEKTKKVGCND